MARKTNTQIMKEHLIFCEGRDEQEFLISYLNSDALSSIPGFSQDIQVMDFGGITELPQRLEILQKMANFETVKSLLIIRDAETNPETARSNIQSALRKNGLPVPAEPCCWEGEALRVGFLLFPTCNKTLQKGTLEDLCFAILSEPWTEDIAEQFEMFRKNLEKRRQEPVRSIFKARLHTYFSLHNNYVSLKIGEAAKAGAFNWASDALDPLKKFLQEIL